MGRLPDRRQKQRYAIELPVAFSASMKAHVVHAGIGKTVNISSRGILFTTAAPLRPGFNLEVAIHWPVLYADRFPVQLRLRGRVVRHDNHGTAVQVFQSCLCRVLRSNDQATEDDGMDIRDSSTEDSARDSAARPQSSNS